MTYDQIFHIPQFPWQYTEDQKCTVLLRTDRKLHAHINILYCDPCDFLSGPHNKMPDLRQLPVEPAFTDSCYQYFRVTVQMYSHKLRYHFMIETDKEVRFYSEAGLTDKEERHIRPFYVPYVYGSGDLKPDWVKGAVWYQIFPDRFCRMEDKRAEDFVPDRGNFYGGSLKGITDRLEYLQSMGVNALYLNPVFRSNSNHGYDIIDYGDIEPRLGTESDFKNLVTAYHTAGFHIMLDGVYNHCGYDSYIWQDVLQKGRQSEYFDWFVIYDEKALFQEECRFLTSERMKKNPPFEAFAFAANMPKWNTGNPKVMDYLISRAEYFTKKYRIDGWRLDVPDEVNRDFLRLFYVRMKKLRPDIYIIGEIWQDAYKWIEDGLFDGVMDYPYYFAIRDFFMTGEIDAEEFCDRVARHRFVLPPEVRKRQYIFCSNHDIKRAFTEAGNQKYLSASAYLFLLLSEGSPGIYYGDELSMEGGEDPDNRRAMNWNKGDRIFYDLIKQLIRFRLENHICENWKCSLRPNGRNILVIKLIHKIIPDKTICINVTQYDKGLTVSSPDKELAWLVQEISRLKKAELGRLV